MTAGASWAGQSAVGRPGRVVIATRGDHGPGEVEVKIRGGVELFIARSPLVLPKGTTVVCVEQLGPRTVLVMPWDDPRDALLGAADEE